MLTEELDSKKICLFCASDYHLEMILLPYIKDKINDSKFVIFTQNNLEETVKKVLDRINIDNELKENIRKINWKNEDEIKFDYIKSDLKEEVNIIINGDYSYINNINKNLKNNINKINIIDCFHIGDLNVDIEEISKKYEYILNTRKI